jgi:hypothetical protein
MPELEMAAYGAIFGFGLGTLCTWGLDRVRYWRFRRKYGAQIDAVANEFLDRIEGGGIPCLSAKIIQTPDGPMTVFEEERLGPDDMEGVDSPR